MYSQAGHCYEEALLHQPHSIATHVQYADVLYTVGGPQNQRLAQTHYAAAIKLSQGGQRQGPIRRVRLRGSARLCQGT